jgi:16S rRNA G966 N2-methylase RsmD
MNNFQKLEYPYYRLYYDFDKNIFLKMVHNFKPNISYIIPNYLHQKSSQLKPFDNKYFIIYDPYSKTSNINNITDYFTESVRVKCAFKNHLSPLEYWTKNKKTIINKLYQQHKKITIYNLREEIFFNYKLCNNFRITVCLAVLQHFKAKKWLDISAGWGDRLLAAIFYNVSKYVSCDPNLDLHPCYQNIIDTFVERKDKHKFKIYPNGFLEINLSNQKFDIVFSSPPFFDLEIYSTHKENSLASLTTKTEDEWIKHFLIPAIIKAYNHLKKNGIMVLYFGGSEKAIYAMQKLNNVMKYLGIIYFCDTNKKPRGMNVWKKVKSGIIDRL